MDAATFARLLELDDPHAEIHRLRSRDPVLFVEGLGFWLALRHDDVKRLFNDPENVTQDRRAWEHYEPRPEGSFHHWVDDRGLFSLSREEHARVRRLVSAAFTPRAIRRMEGQIQEVVDRMAAPLQGRSGEVLDLLGDFANLVPNTVISRLTGIEPGDDEVRFRELAQSAIAGFLPLTPPDLQARAEAAATELAGWVRELCAKRAANPGEDLVSDLLCARDAGQQLDEDEIVLLLTGLIGAGSETTALGAVSILKTLLPLPETLERLRADRPLIETAMDEILRVSLGGPAGMVRFALRDFELRGRPIRKGQMILLSVGGANRDPEVYEDPDTLDLDRRVRDLLSFGNGPHYCLGANLARREMACMLDALLDVLPPGSRLRGDLALRQDAGLFRRPLNFPVEVGPAR